MGDIQEAKRKLLEAAVVRAALNLSQYMGSGGYALPVLNTNPQLYVVFGTKKAIGNLLQENSDADSVATSTG